MLSLLLALSILTNPAANAAEQAPAPATAPAAATTTTSVPTPTTSVIQPGEQVGRIGTTGVAVKLQLPGLEVDPQALKALKRRYFDRAVAQGKLRGGDASVLMLSAYGEVHPSRKWRETLMAGKLVGAGQFDVGATACTEQSKDLEPPYSEIGWHAFLTVADTCFDLSVFSLCKSGVSPYTRSEFEAAVRGARFAIVRLGAWNEMPLPVLDRMHEGLTRPDGDGVTYLNEQAATAADGWACALAAAEIGIATKTPATERLALCDRVLADLARIEKPSKPESFAKLTAISGRAIALRDAGKLDDALAALNQAKELAKEHTAVASVVLSYDTSTVLAGKHDVEGAVAALKAAIAGDEDRRSFATHDPSFQPLAEEKTLLALLRAPK